MSLLPQNYRIIPAKKHVLLVALITSFIAFVGLCVLAWYLFQIYENTQIERRKELKALNMWVNLISKYPNYPEVYYNAAFYEARVGDQEKARDYLKKSLRLNPNYTPSISLQKELGN